MGICDLWEWEYYKQQEIWSCLAYNLEFESMIHEAETLVKKTLLTLWWDFLDFQLVVIRRLGIKGLLLVELHPLGGYSRLPPRGLQDFRIPSVLVGWAYVTSLENGQEGDFLHMYRVSG